jgi:alanine dehydrogenase
MIVGIPREIKADEYRVALLPVGAELLTRDGHTVLVERGAGLGSGFDDADYVVAGATVVDGPQEVFSRADLLVKVKEPQPAEIARLRAGQAVFCYFHFAASRELTQACLRSGITAVAYETLQDAGGRLPLLTPMSEVAGKMSIQEGAKYLERPMMGRGILLGGVPGVEPARVLILGGGVVGANAARVAAGLGAWLLPEGTLAVGATAGAVLLSAVAAGVVMSTGHLGGKLVYAHGAAGAYAGDAAPAAGEPGGHDEDD